MDPLSVKREDSVLTLTPVYPFLNFCPRPVPLYFRLFTPNPYPYHRLPNAVGLPGQVHWELFKQSPRFEEGYRLKKGT